MKKWIALTLSALLLLSLTACGQESPEDPAATPPAQTEQTQTETPGQAPQQEEPTAQEAPSLVKMRELLTQGGYLCGVAYLGNLPQGTVLADFLKSQTLPEGADFLTDLPQDRLVAYEGTEVYCLVPRDPQATLTVQEFLSNEANGYQGKPGETLYSGGGDPVVLACNVNDVLPNLLVTLNGAGGEKMVYNPSRSLCDGTVALPATAKAYDFSHYQTEAVQPTTHFLGSWQNQDGGLQFNDDGTMTHWTGPDPTQAAETMTGTFYEITNSSQYPAGSILFELKRTAGTDFWGVFTLTIQDDQLTVTNVAGEQILGSKESSFTAT